MKRFTYAVASLLASGLIAIAGLACGGDDDTPAGATGGIDLLSGSTPSSQSGASTGQTSQPTPTQAASSPAETVEPTEENILDAILNVLAEPNEPADGTFPVPTGSDATLGATPNDEAAAALEQVLTNAGLDMTGIDLYVFPVTGEDTSMLVVNIDANSMETPGGDDAPLRALLAAPEIQTANVSHVAFNYDGPEGAFTGVLPIQALQDAAAGTISPDELWQQLAYEER